MECYYWLVWENIDLVFTRQNQNKNYGGGNAYDYGKRCTEAQIFVDLPDGCIGYPNRIHLVVRLYDKVLRRPLQRLVSPVP